MRLPIEFLIEKYKDHVYATAFSVCKNREDSDDIVQDTFIQYFRNGRKEFESEEHIRAWLLRVAINKSKNLCRSFWRTKRIPFEDYMTELSFNSSESVDVFRAVMNLPVKYRIICHLFYYEGYKIKEIAEMMSVNENTVKTRLARGRKQLKEQLKEEWNENE